MREIKFRCWHKGYERSGRSKEIPPAMFYDEKPGDCLVYKKQGQPVEIMQFTGLHDKNGKEIYEGDILKGNREVRFFNGCFIALHKDFDDCISSAPKYQLEVIGNIYENPELVSGTQKGLDLDG